MNDIVKKIILFTLQKKEHNIEMSDFDKLLKYRLVGHTYNLIINNIFTCDQELYIKLKFIYNVNKERNNLILREIKNIDQKMDILSINRLWLKGARELIRGEIDFGIRKMVDSDILIDSKDYDDQLVEKLDLSFGVYDRVGEYHKAPREVILYAIENSYEYPTMSKAIPIDLSEIDSHLIDIELLNRYRIFKNNRTGKFFTDFILNMHHDLSHGLESKVNLGDGTLPIMEEIDDLWFLMYKTYYEVIKGNSTDYQRLIETIIKIQQSNIPITEIEKKFKLDYPIFYNKEVFEFYTDILEKNSIDDLFLQ